MRKCLFWIMTLLLVSALVPAMAADAVTEYPLDSIPAMVSLSDQYIVLTPSNLSGHAELLASLNLDAESALADWEARGVLLQAWVPTMDACLEIRAVQDSDAATYFNLDEQTAQARASYRASHLKGASWANMGYSIKSAEWKKQSKGGRFLRIKYKRTQESLVYWGYAAKTVRNGWTLVLDYQVYGRSLKAKDETSLNKVANTVVFSKSDAMPTSVGGLLEFTSTPPEETDTGAFTVEGTCTPGAHLIGVVMRYSSPTPTRVETDANRSGKFKMKVQLPSEGIWLMTLTVELNGKIVKEEVFNTTIYQTTLIPLNLESEIPERFETDEFVLAGTTSKGVTVQCVVSGGDKPFDKTVRTNGTGKFTFKIPTSSQSAYDVTLILQKKGYETRRMNWTANRMLTQEDIENQYRASAIKPAYTTLASHLDTYEGKVMGYKVYITEIKQAGEEWLVFAALTKSRNGKMKNLIEITCPEEPNLIVGSEVKMYGVCSGAYEVQSEEETETYPGFDLLFWDPVT